MQTQFSWLIVVLIASACDSGSLATGADAKEPMRRHDSQERTDARTTAGPSPSNRDDVGLFRATGLNVGPPSGNFNTDLDCAEVSVLGQCELADREGLPGLCVCRMDELTISSLTVVGTRGLVVLASSTIAVTGVLSVGAKASTPGPGAMPTQHAISVGSSFGGSYGSMGGNQGLPPHGDASLEPLLGGMAGQDSCSGGWGGGGGGAIQLSAAEKITVSGFVLAGGGGGGTQVGGCAIHNGAGGGSGGAILLEAGSVEVTGVVAANGGGGAGGSGLDGNGFSGYDGAAGQGFGGEGRDGYGCDFSGYTNGGTGGNGSLGDLPGQNGEPGDFRSGCFGDDNRVDPGGGGGGAGRIRINTTTGCQCQGTFSPSPSVGMFH